MRTIDELKTLTPEQLAPLAEKLKLRMTLPGAVLSRADLFVLGWEDRTDRDVIFRSCRVVRHHAKTRSTKVLVEDYQAYLERSASLA